MSMNILTSIPVLVRCRRGSWQRPLSQFFKARTLTSKYSLPRQVSLTAIRTCRVGAGFRMSHLGPWGEHPHSVPYVFLLSGHTAWTPKILKR